MKAARILPLMVLAWAAICGDFARAQDTMAFNLSPRGSFVEALKHCLQSTDTVMANKALLENIYKNHPTIFAKDRYWTFSEGEGDKGQLFDMSKGKLVLVDAKLSYASICVSLPANARKESVEVVNRQREIQRESMYKPKDKSNFWRTTLIGLVIGAIVAIRFAAKKSIAGQVPQSNAIMSKQAHDAQAEQDKTENAEFIKRQDVTGLLTRDRDAFPESVLKAIYDRSLNVAQEVRGRPTTLKVPRQLTTNFYRFINFERKDIEWADVSKSDFYNEAPSYQFLKKYSDRTYIFCSQAEAELFKDTIYSLGLPRALTHDLEFSDSAPIPEVSLTSMTKLKPIQDAIIIHFNDKFNREEDFLSRLLPILRDFVGINVNGISEPTLHKWFGEQSLPSLRDATFGGNGNMTSIVFGNKFETCVVFFSTYRCKPAVFSVELIKHMLPFVDAVDMRFMGSVSAAEVQEIERQIKSKTTPAAA